MTDQPKGPGDRFFDGVDKVFDVLDSFSSKPAEPIPATPAPVRIEASEGRRLIGGASNLRELKLVTPEIKLIEFVRVRGGEIPWDWSKVPTVGGKALVANLINKGIMIEREHVTHANQVSGALHLALTDQGKAIAAELARVSVQ